MHRGGLRFEYERKRDEVSGSHPLKQAHIELTRLTTPPDRKSTRLNSSHSQSSYALFCLKKKTVEQRTSQGQPASVERSGAQHGSKSPAFCATRRGRDEPGSPTRPPCPGARA